MSDASVVLTLPASFDESARAATLEAARRAGLKASLLEEPQAAFYDFMAKEGVLAALLGRKPDALVLVVDVGGGTTDLSLVSVERRGSTFACTRIATGDHLLLGGDNMDLALAAIARAKMGEAELDAFLMGQLVERCRAAKEALLSEDGPDAVPITIAARGSKLVGKTLSTRLTKVEVRKALLDGFFPAAPEGRLPPLRRAALVSAGLPYARDPAITHHVVRFLEKYGGGRAPTALLLNGGVFRSRPLRLALARAIRERTGERLVVLEESSPDLAVARGAARYGVVRTVAAEPSHRMSKTSGMRIEAGATRSYYVGVGASEGEGDARAICVVPRGTLEGVRCEVTAPVLKLRTGDLARFDLYRARSGIVSSVGELVPVTEKTHARLRPLVTRVEGTAGHVEVLLAGELTPVGTLGLSLRETGGKKRSFTLEFQVRAQGPARPARAEASTSPSPPSWTGKAVLAPVAASPELRKAEACILHAFGFAQKSGRAVSDLVRAIEAMLGDRLQWNVHDARRLFDVLFEQRNARKWSAEHERVFWQLAGLCLRPGFGAPGDDRRTRELFSLFAQRLAFGDRPPVVASFYIAWRRIAPGLDRHAQRAMFDVLFALLPSAPGAKAPVAESELREVLTFFERVDAARKVGLGERLLQGAPRPTLLAELARLGARVPVYGDAADVVAADIVEGWLATMPSPDWSRTSTLANVVKLARVTETNRDLSRKTRRRLAKELTRQGAPKDGVRALEEHVPLTTAERGASFGDALPPGLTLSEEFAAG